MKYVCELCGTIYDEEVGDVRHGIPAGTAFEALPQDYTCPCCGSEQEAFSKAVKKCRITYPNHADRGFWQNVKYSDFVCTSER